MTQISWRAKFFATAFAGTTSLFWIALMVGISWEIVSFKCQPSPEQVICKLYGEPTPGKTRYLEIPKNQLSRIKMVRQRQGRHQAILVTIDRQEIPLVRTWSGDVTAQLDRQFDRITKFIADPQAKTLSIETYRNLNPLAILMTIGVIWFNGTMMKKVWFDR
jgi:hypothetical protein